MPDLLYEGRTIAVARATLAAAEGTPSTRRRIFLLSPANASGIRGQRLLAETAKFELALRLRNSGAPIGVIYQFISSLYFRGKLEYARKFQNPPRAIAGVQIITGSGLMLPETLITWGEFQGISATSIDAKNADYRRPLDNDLLRLRESVGCEVDVILLGSIASPKYITPIREVFGERLLFPREFVGLGDMSRGSILLRCCAQGSELEYIPVGKL